MKVQSVNTLANSIFIETEIGNFFILGNGNIVDENEEKIDPELAIEVKKSFMEFKQKELQADIFKNPISHLKDAVDRDLYDREVNRIKNAEDESESRDLIENLLGSEKFGEFMNKRKKQLSGTHGATTGPISQERLIAIHYVHVGTTLVLDSSKKLIDIYRNRYSLNIDGVEERFIPSVTRSEIEFIVV